MAKKKTVRKGVTTDLGKIWATEIRVGTLVVTLVVYHLVKFASNIYLV